MNAAPLPRSQGAAVRSATVETPLRSHPDLQVCPECDALYAKPALANDAVARCRRCGATLGRGHWLPADGQLALSVAAAVVYAIATLSPIVTLELRGVHAVSTMIEATRLTWDSGEHLVAVLAAATVIVFPLLVILLRLWLLAPLVAGQPTPGLVPALHALRWLTRWSMVEVFMLAVLIAVVRSAGVTNVVPGAGIFAYGTLAVLLAAVQATGLEGLWQQVRPAAP
jgi:paraquat-inducible protein A